MVLEEVRNYLTLDYRERVRGSDTRHEGGPMALKSTCRSLRAPRQGDNCVLR